jgi:hypothetical protein
LRKSRKVNISYQPFLTRMAKAAPGSSTLARPMLGGQLHFWFAIDPTWTRDTLFPLFEWEPDPLAAEQAWHGFLYWGRPTRMLMSELMPHVVRSFAHMNQLKGVRERFVEYLAWTAYGAEHNPLDAGWIEKFLHHSEPADRQVWAQTFRSILGELEREERDRLWGDWLCRYLQQRLEMGVPVQDDEWAEVVHWSLPLVGRLPDLVPILRKGPAGKASVDTMFYYKLSKSDESLQHPEALADLVAYLLAAAKYPFRDGEFVATLVRRIPCAEALVLKIRAIAERLAVLGCDEARQLWEVAGAVERK